MSTKFIAAVHGAVIFFKSFFSGMNGMAPATVGIGRQEHHIAPDIHDRVEPVPQPAREELLNEVKDDESEIPPEQPNTVKSAKTELNAAMARDFLHAKLSDGPVQVAAIKRTAKEVGFTERQLRYAADKLKVVRTKSPGAGNRFIWSLPEAETVVESHTDHQTCSDIRFEDDVA